jgi:trk system potassium uptake protein
MNTHFFPQSDLVPAGGGERMKIIVIGCGRVGAKLAQLLSQKGNQIVVIDNDPAAFERLGKGFKGSTVVGVGFDRDILIAAGIERADGLAAVMESDEANVIAARIAMQMFRVPRVVARVYEPRKAEIYRRLGIQTLSPVSIGVEYFADLLSHSPTDSAAPLGNGDANLINVEIPHLFCGRRVSDMNVPAEVNVIAITRGGKTFIPTPKTEFAEGDLVHLAVQNTAMEKVKEMLGL